MKKWVYAVLIILISFLIITGCGQQTEKKEDPEMEKPVVTEEKDSNLETESDTVTPGGLSESKDKSELEKSKDRLEQDNVLKYYSPFSGQLIGDLMLRRAVMASIENTPAARPQSGLDEASIVYEFLVEGGVTRFLALYWYQIPDKIGPIRSLRPYLINTALEYDPLLLHAGASPGGFKLLNEVEIQNLDQIFNGSNYWRSRERKTPHNLYSANFKINDYLDNLTGWKYEPRFSFQQVSFFSGGEMEKAEEIVINYWGNYQVCYRYNSERNHYIRFFKEFETPHITVNGKQLTADNIIVQFTATEVKDEVGRLNIKLRGEGKALIFRNGIVKQGEWRKDGPGYTRFYNERGERVNFNPGQTWIQVVPESTIVNYGKGKNDK